MGSNCNICSNKCFGIDGHHGSCCTIEDRNWIIGPHTDTEEFLVRLSEKFGRKISFNDVFYTYEEGSRLFPNKKVWQNEGSYPALRVDLNKPRLPCIFYNNKIKACSIYEIRPEICKNYECEYLKTHSQ